MMRPENRADYLSDLVAGYQPALVLMTANELDLFTVLGDDSLTAEDLARRLGTDVRGTAHLTDVLVALGFLRKEGGRYSNSTLAERFLVRGAPDYQGHIIRHHQRMHRRWSRLTDAVRTGKHPESVSEDRTREDTEAFIRGMADIGRKAARELAMGLDLRGVDRLLDLGAGPGLYTIEILRRLPETATGVVFDQAGPLEIAAEFVAEAGMQNRIVLQEGDFLTTELGTGFDLVLLSNILHMLSPEDASLLVRRAARCLNPGGRVVVKDFLFNEDRTGPVFAALFAVNMLTARGEGTTYTHSEIAAWMEQAGMPVIQRFAVARYSHVLVGLKEER